VGGGLLDGTVSWRSGLHLLKEINRYCHNLWELVWVRDRTRAHSKPVLSSGVCIALVFQGRTITLAPSSVVHAVVALVKSTKICFLG